MDISKILKNAGTSILEKKAREAFGSVANSFGSNQGGTLSQVIGVAGNSSISGIDPTRRFRSLVDNSTVEGAAGEWNTVSYAADIASGQAGLDPKLPFLFKVRFQFDPAAVSGSNEYQDLTRNLSFVVKQIDMPQFKFNYEEFNYYNFRTKMLRNIEYDPIQFKMYDDIANNAIKFVNLYVRLLSPIHRNSWNGDDLEKNGFNFTPPDGAALDSSLRSVLGSDGSRKNILKSMTVEEYYLDRTGGKLQPQGQAIRSAIKVNVYTLINPRLTGVQLPEHSYEGDQPQVIGCNVEYDALHIEIGESLDSLNSRNGSSSAPVKDVLDDTSAGAWPETSSGGGGGNSNPYSDLISRQGRPVSNNFNIMDAFNSNSPGNGGFGAAGSIGGTLGTAAKRALSQATGNMAAGIIPPMSKTLLDKSIGTTLIKQTISKKLGLGG